MSGIVFELEQDVEEAVPEVLELVRRTAGTFRWQRRKFVTLRLAPPTLQREHDPASGALRWVIRVSGHDVIAAPGEPEQQVELGTLAELMLGQSLPGLTWVEAVCRDEITGARAVLHRILLRIGKRWPDPSKEDPVDPFYSEHYLAAEFSSMLAAELAASMEPRVETPTGASATTPGAGQLMEEELPAWFPKKEITLKRWRKAYGLIAEMRKEAADPQNWEADSLPKLADYRQRLKERMNWSPSEKVVGRILQAGDGGKLKK